MATSLRPLYALGITCVISATLFAADPPPVPDPFGLGERLALIDELKEHYHQVPAAGASLQTLRDLYAKAWSAEQAKRDAETSPPEIAAARTSDNMIRLRAVIRSRFGVTADDQLDESGLRALKERLEKERAQGGEKAVLALNRQERSSFLVDQESKAEEAQKLAAEDAEAKKLRKVESVKKDSEVDVGILPYEPETKRRKGRKQSSREDVDLNGDRIDFSGDALILSDFMRRPTMSFMDVSANVKFYDWIHDGNKHTYYLINEGREEKKVRVRVQAEGEKSEWVSSSITVPPLHILRLGTGIFPRIQTGTIIGGHLDAVDSSR